MPQLQRFEQSLASLHARGRQCQDLCLLRGKWGAPATTVAAAMPMLAWRRVTMEDLRAVSRCLGRDDLRQLPGAIVV
jgi:hypothetical protein